MFFNINIKKEDFIRYDLINLYNKINIFSLNCKIKYDYCENTSYTRLKYYINKYKYDKYENSILLMYKNKESKIKFFENEDLKEYKISFINKDKGKTQIFITNIKQEQEYKISLINIMTTLILLTIKYGYIPFLMKIFIDYKLINMNTLKIKLLKYLESNSIVNICYNKTIDSI